MKRDAGNATKKKRLSKDEIKEQFLSSLLGRGKVETVDLNEKIDNVDKCEDVAIIVKD